MATFLVDKRGYDPAIKMRDFDLDQEFLCKVNFASLNLNVWSGGRVKPCNALYLVTIYDI